MKISSYNILRNREAVAKSGNTNTFGIELDSAGPMTFVPGATLELFVDEDSASVAYNGTNYCTGTHTNLDLDHWPNGAVCVVEAEDVSGGNTVFTELDNFKSWRPEITTVTNYQASFTNVPDGMMLRALPEDLSVHRYWSSARYTETYVTNGRVMWIPDTNTYGSTWLNARRDYQNNLYMTVTDGVAEVQIALRDFSQGWAKVGMLPEHFEGDLYNTWTSDALYLELERDGSNVNCTAYRQFDRYDAGRTKIGNTVTVVYNPDADISLKVNTNWIRAYYGATQIVNTNHEMVNFCEVYSVGVSPHLEFQSKATANGAVTLDYLKVRARSDFGLPE